MKVIIIHGWGTFSPEGNWKSWLKEKLEEKNIKVIIPKMPDSENPVIEKWVAKLGEVAGQVDENTYFVGQSIGVQTILRYLENLGEGIKVGGCILVAGWFDLLETAYEEPEEEKKIAKPWIENKIDFEKVKKHCDKFVSIFSDDDYCVDVNQSRIFKKKLDSEIIVQSNKGHFTTEDGVTELPIVLRKLEDWEGV